MNTSRRLSLSSTGMQSSLAGVLLVMLSAFCFSTSVLFIRLVNGLDAMTITFYRSLFAFLFFCALLPRYPEPLQFARYRRQIPLLLGMGAAMAITAILYTYAVQHTTAANAALLVNSSPLYVALLSPWLLKEPRPRWTLPGLLLAGVGIVLITDPGQLTLESAAFGGILAALLAGFTYALPMIIGRRLRQHVSGITQGWWGTGLIALTVSPFALSGDLALAASQLHLLIPMGVISLGMSWLLMFLGLQRCSAQVVSVTALMEPVFAALIGLLLLAEVMTPAGALGSALILGAIYLISR